MWDETNNLNSKIVSVITEKIRERERGYDSTKEDELKVQNNFDNPRTKLDKE